MPQQAAAEERALGIERVDGDQHPLPGAEEHTERARNRPPLREGPAARQQHDRDEQVPHIRSHLLMRQYRVIADHRTVTAKACIRPAQATGPSSAPFR
jgi:hypothetical protein